MREMRLLPLLAVFLWGCAADTRFVRTDDAFAPTPAGSAPKVYFDALPEVPYRAVGIISVVVDVLAGRGTIAAAAAEEGQREGCMVLVERKLHDKRGVHGELELMRVHEGGASHHEDSGAATRKVEFICGVAVTPTTGA